jgi:hypothetical protein
MEKYKSKILAYITSEFLFLCWRDLLIKEKKVNVDISRNKNYFEPISKNWFKKTAILIKNGHLSYKIFKGSLSSNDNSSKSLLNKVKFLIIQNAFTFVLRISFESYFVSCYNLCVTDTLVLLFV